MLSIVLSLCASAAVLDNQAVAVKVNVPDERSWVGSTDTADPDGQSYRLHRPGNLPPLIFIKTQGGVQPDFSKSDPIEVFETFSGREVEPGSMTVERIEHPTLGLVLMADFSKTPSFKGTTFATRMALFELGSGVGVVLGMGIPGRGGWPERMTQSLDMIEPRHPAVPWSEQATGEVSVGPATLTLPEGYRLMTDLESKHLGDIVGERAHFVDPARMNVVGGCVVNDFGEWHPEFLEMAKSPQEERNYRIRTRAMLRGGSYVTSSSGDATSATSFAGSALGVESSSVGTVTRLQLGDRVGYQWTLPGTLQDEEQDILVVSTAYDDKHLDCTAVLPKGADLSTWTTALQTLRVTDGAAHPLVLSPMAQWIGLWPWPTPPPNPLWFIVPVLSLASFAGWRLMGRMG